MPQTVAHARWIVSQRDRDAEAKLQKELGIPSMLAAVLAQRGLHDPDEANSFLNPSYSQFHDPRLLPDYEAARDAILGARERGGRAVGLLALVGCFQFRIISGET